MNADGLDLTAYLLFAEEYGWTPAQVDALPPYVRNAALDLIAGKRVHKGEMTINDARRLVGMPEFAEGGLIPGPAPAVVAEPSGERISRYLRYAPGFAYTDDRGRIEFPADWGGEKVAQWLRLYRRELRDEGDEGAAGIREPRDPKPTPVAPGTTANAAQTITVHLDGQELFNAMAPHMERYRRTYRARNGHDPFG